MLSVADALNHILEHARTKLPGEVALAEAVGLVLAEEVASDIDSPPHDKAMVDGYAVLSADVVAGRAKLGVLEEITAGAVPTCKVIPGFCSRIMTGAPLPAGADAVVMVERTGFNPSPLTPLPQGARGILGTVEIHDERFRAGQNIMRRGKSLRQGETVLHSGVELGPAEIGLLAEVGHTQIRAIPLVKMAMVSTGNELLPADQKPTAGKIRNSNGPLLAAAAQRAGATPVDLGIVRDEPHELRRCFRAGLESDVLVISGGVSAGVLDLVPAVLVELGVRQVFHKVDLKPGKPLWFGVCEKPLGDGSSNPKSNPRAEPGANVGDRTLVFGLPGNPVSSLVCFELFVKPAIARLAGRHWESPHPVRRAKLTREFSQRSDRPTYYPALVVSSAEGLLAEPKAWQGSADLRGFAGANALLVFPAGEKIYAAGEAVDVLMLSTA
ncbi:MAG TPA: gephyrin-like molybdotransferase Glp [Pirellulales bacterium]|jgi:molybdopterin molybdotransferase|nr:gephyrin-like molybdotransferase Glp [Pirellulales bacterium]